MSAVDQSHWRRTLRPWARLYFMCFRLVARHLHRMSEDELRELLQATAWPTERNCSFDVYRVAQLLHPVIVQELHRRPKR